MSKKPLQKPVVSCRLGFLYNKEELINAMLDKRLPKIYSHIKSLKDVKDLIITTSNQNQENKIICPISMIEFSGLNSFYFSWNCGCLISKKAFDELHMKDKCVLCGKLFSKEKDLVNLNYSKEERAQIFQNLIIEKLKSKKTKTDKKESKKEKNTTIDNFEISELKKLEKKKDTSIKLINDKKIEIDNLIKEEEKDVDIVFMNKKRKRS